MRSVKLRLSEADIQRTCCDFLIADGWRLLRTDPVSNRLLGKGFGEIGMADCLFLRYRHPNLFTKVRPQEAEVLWVEFKSAGRKPTSAQMFWHERERSRGALTWIAGVDFEASIEGFMEHYAKSGLQRRVPA